jgi:hypothetical protein
MATSPFHSSRFVKQNTCLPCCAAAPTGCSCALEIPPFASPYADYATAETAIADQTSNCIGYVVYTPAGDPDNVFTAAFDGTTLELDGTTDGNGALPGTRAIDTFADVSLLSGGVLSVAYAITTDGTDYEATIELLDCADGTVLDSDTASTATGTLTVTAPADGEYVLRIQNRAGVGAIDANYITATNDVTCDLTYWVNPVIAIWDDSGTTRSFWACPKFLLPPGTESSGDWYVDETEAQGVIDDFTNGCTAYTTATAASYSAYSYSVTGTTSLSMSGSETSVIGLDPGVLNVLGCFNAVAGDDLTVAWTYSSTGDDPAPSPGILSVGVFYYDESGTQQSVLDITENPDVDSDSGSSSTGALPFTGKYYVALYAQSRRILDPWESETTAATVGITSDGDMSVNTIQALYDLSLSCPARLDC